MKAFSLFFILVAPVLIGSTVETFSLVGKLVVYSFSSLYLLGCLWENPKKIRLDLTLVTPLVLFCFYLIVRSDNLAGLLLGLQFLLVALFFIFMSTEKAIVVSSAHALFGWIFFVFFASFLFDLVTPWYANSNFAGVLAFIYAVLAYAVSRSRFLKVIVALAALLMIALTGTRSVLVGILFSAFYSYVFFKAKIPPSFKIVAAVAGVVSLLFIGFIAFDLRDSYALNDWFLENTGKRFETGRFDMWIEMLSDFDFISYAFGLGGGAVLGDFSSDDKALSAHSLYVYMIGTYGFLGIFQLFYLFSVGLFRLWQSGRTLAFFASIVLIVRDFFEVSLVHNNFPLALIFWGVFLSGFVSRARK